MSILDLENLAIFSLSLVLSMVYFMLLKKKLVRKSDFKISSSKLKFDTVEINFESIKEYKIRWMNGAELKLTLNNGRKVRLSSNDSICNSDKFVKFCQEIDLRLSKYNNGSVIKKKSFFETKNGYYYAIVMTGFFVIITIYKYVVEDDVRLMNFLMIVSLLGLMWSGVKWKKER